MHALRYRDHESSFPTDARVRRSLKRSWLGDLVIRRHFHAYGIGIERTGTTFLSSVIQQHYRAQHEIEWYFLADMFANEDVADESEVRRWLRERDRTLRLEFESCHLLGPFTDHLADLFPEAKFILTVRHPRTWMSSVTNWALNHDVLRPDGPWRPVMDRYYADPTDPVGEICRPNAWSDTNLYSIDGYLSGWARHNRHVLSNVPGERLLIVPTTELSNRLEDIALFLDLDRPLTATLRTNRNQNRKKHDLLAPLDDDLLQNKIDAYCGPLISRFDLLDG
jgi:hypothetical protein